MLPKKLIPVILVLLFNLCYTHAQKRVTAVRFDAPPIIDGIISEEVWMQADPVTDFIQREPLNGQPPTYKTEVYIGFDQHYLYITFRCYGDSGSITAKELARDVSLAYDDRIQVILDTSRGLCPSPLVP